MGVECFCNLIALRQSKIEEVEKRGLVITFEHRPKAACCVNGTLVNVDHKRICRIRAQCPQWVDVRTTDEGGKQPSRVGATQTPHH